MLSKFPLAHSKIEYRHVDINDTTTDYGINTVPCLYDNQSKRLFEGLDLTLAQVLLIYAELYGREELDLSVFDKSTIEPLCQEYTNQWFSAYTARQKSQEALTTNNNDIQDILKPINARDEKIGLNIEDVQKSRGEILQNVQRT